MDALVVRMALFRSEGAGRELPSFVTIITELSKHDLGELVGEGGKGTMEGEREAAEGGAEKLRGQLWKKRKPT